MWKQLWQEGRTPWDQGHSSYALQDLVMANELPEGRALVPGAGSGYDLLTLASAKRHCTGLDLSPLAVERFNRLREKVGVPAEWADLVVADFFEWSPAEKFDVIYDYTFLCAIRPERRVEWADRMSQLLSPEGELVTLIFPTAPPHGEDGSPPHLTTPDQVSELLASDFEQICLEKVKRSVPSRMGREWLGRWKLKSAG